MRPTDRHPREEHDEDVAPPQPIDLRELVRLHPRLLLAAGLVAVIMFPVGLFLAALAIGVLEVSGGAAHDTSIVVAVAGYVVADFWGGGIVAALTQARAPQVAAAWGVARLVVIAVVALVASGFVALLPVQLILAIPAAWAGARVARKQAALRREIRAERARTTNAHEPNPPVDAMR